MLVPWRPAALFLALLGCGDNAAEPDATMAADTPIDHTAFNCHHGSSVSVCEPSTQYCMEFAAGVRAAEPTYGCVELPASCLAPTTCDCLLASLPADMCGIYSRDCQVRGDRITMFCVGP